MNMLPISDLKAASVSSPEGESEVDYVGGQIDKIPGAVRMLLVDTKLFSGKISEVPLDGNTLVTGTNAAGKTSIIQLLPLFNGVSPSKISNKSQGKNFYRHYLPNSTSYVAFEYRHRDGGRRSVIIYAAPSEDKPMFRFVRSPLYENMFVKKDGTFVEAAELSAHLRDQGYTVADKVIETMVDYRTIILGLPVPKVKSKDHRFLTRMVSDYTMSQAGHPLMNLDRVVYSMLKKDVSLKALEEMIAEKILQGSDNTDPSDERKGLETWPLRYKAYQEVMAHEDDARILQQDCLLMSNYEADRDAALAELLALRTTNEQSLLAAEASEKKTEQTLKSERDNYDAEKEVLHSATTDALAKRNRIHDKIDAIEEQKKGYVGIGVKVELSKQKSTIEANRIDAKERLAALEGDHAELSERYKGLKQAAKDEADVSSQVIRAEQDAARTVHENAVAAAKVRHTASEERVTLEHGEAIKTADEAKSEAQTDLGAARQATKNPQVDAAVEQQHEAARNNYDAAAAKVGEAYKGQAALAESVKLAEEQADSQDKALRAQKQELSDLQDALVKLESIRKPKSGTLLAYLRNHREDWADDIGRVINPEILHNSDLDPEEIEGTADLFGLKLDISRLTPIDEADLTETINKIDETKAEIVDLEAAIAKTKKLQTAAHKDAIAARNEAAIQKALIKSLEGKQDAAKEILGARKKDLDDAKETAAEDAQKRLKAAQEHLRQETENHDAAIASRDAALTRLKDANDQEIDSLDEAKSEALEDCAKRLKEIETVLKGRLTDLDRELKNALKNEGIDPKVMEELRKTIGQCDEDLKSIRLNAALVAKWLSFKAIELQSLPQLRRELEDAKTEYDKEFNAEMAFKAKWKLREDVLKKRIKSDQGIISGATESIRKINLRLSKIEHSHIKPADQITRTFDELLRDLNDAEKEARKLHQSICAGVTEISQIFLAVADSPAEQHLRLHMKNFKSSAENPEWVPALIDWYDTQHQQPRDSILTDGRVITNSIKAGYYNLISLERKIKSENARLQAGLNKNNIIDVVQDLQVTITSSISKLEFLPAMKRLADLHEKWTKSNDLLPPEGFTEAMSTLLTFWKGKSGVLDNLRDQIRIEGYLVENGNRREFHAGTDMRDVSSNGVSYLILTTILVGFVNMVRGKSPVHIVWALDELGNIDPENTRRLLDMLADNNITLVAATPQATAAVNKLFDYRIKVIDGPQLADIRNAGRPSQRLTMSPFAKKVPALEQDPTQKDAQNV